MTLEKIKELKNIVSGHKAQGWKDVVLETTDVVNLLQIAEAAYTLVNKCDIQHQLHWLDDLRRAFK